MIEVWKVIGIIVGVCVSELLLVGNDTVVEVLAKPTAPGRRGGPGGPSIQRPGPSATIIVFVITQARKPPKSGLGIPVVFQKYLAGYVKV